MIRRSGLAVTFLLLLVSSLYAQPSFRSLGTLLYDQTLNSTGQGLLSQYETDNGEGNYHTEAADDFIVPIGGWQLDGVTILGEYIEPSLGKADSVDILIYSDTGGMPDDSRIICQYVDFPLRDDFAGDLSIRLDPICHLKAGSYWLGVIVNMPYVTDGQFGWEYRTVTNGTPAVWRNPKNGYASGCVNWTTLTQCDTPGAEITGDLAFKLYTASTPDEVCISRELLLEDTHEDGFSDWVSSAGEGNNLWTGKTDGGFSSNNYWFVANVDGDPNTPNEATDSYLTSPVFTIPSNGLQVSLRFYHKYNMERTFDGGVVEYSVNGEAFIDAGKENFIQNGYPLNLVTQSTSPLRGQPAFTGMQNSYIESAASLTVAGGDQVVIRFRQANDDLGSVTGGGWWVDDVRVHYCTAFAIETPAPTWTLSVMPTDATPSITPTENPSLELVKNGGFELLDTSQKSVLTPWTVRNATRDKIKCHKDKDGDGVIDKSFANKGNCAFRFKGSGGRENSKLQQSIDISGLTFRPASALKLRVSVHAETTAITVKVRVKYSDGTDTGKITFDTLPNPDYTEVYQTLVLDSIAVEKIKLQIQHKSAKGKVFIDDISLMLDKREP